MEQKFCSTNSLRKVMGKPGKPFKTSRFSATNRDSPVSCRHGAINHPQAALAMWPWRSPIGMAPTTVSSHGILQFISPCLLITDRNIYYYINICIIHLHIHIRSIYIYIPAKSTCAKFWPLSWEYEISAPCNKKTAVFVSKKNVLGRSPLNHVQVVLIQIVIPMLPLLAPAISTKSATEEHAWHASVGWASC